MQGFAHFRLFLSGIVSQAWETRKSEYINEIGNEKGNIFFLQPPTSPSGIVATAPAVKVELPQASDSEPRKNDLDEGAGQQDYFSWLAVDSYFQSRTYFAM